MSHRISVGENDNITALHSCGCRRKLKVLEGNLMDRRLRDDQPRRGSWCGRTNAGWHGSGSRRRAGCGRWAFCWRFGAKVCPSADRQRHNSNEKNGVFHSPHCIIFSTFSRIRRAGSARVPRPSCVFCLPIVFSAVSSCGSRHRHINNRSRLSAMH